MFDPKCYELAKYILPSDAVEQLKNMLAQHIQDAVADWLRTTEAELSEALERKLS